MTMNVDYPLQKVNIIESQPGLFGQSLAANGLSLIRGKTTTLQINLGILCNQVCRHCHHNAGPDRKEVMTSEIAGAVIAYAERSGFDTIDITCGAADLNPNIFTLIEKLSPLSAKLILRSNLSALNDGKRDDLIELLKMRKVIIVASFPSINETQADSQRGQGIFNKSIETLKKLNATGYGLHETGLELDIVSNPVGMFLPASQVQTERRFREVLMKRWRIQFNNLFALTNVPLGRFYEWLVEKGNLDEYLSRLRAGFYPCAVDGLMCRSLISVSWDGYLFDCDFNQVRRMYLGGEKIHVSQMAGHPPEGNPINIADHCYACTAGAGFTCGGAISG